MAQETVTISKKDLEQDRALSAAVDRIILLEESRNTISYSAIRPITAVLMVIYGITSAAVGLYANSLVNPVELAIESIEEDVTELKSQNNNFALSTSVNELKIAVARSASGADVAEIKSDVKETARELRTFENTTADRISEIEKAQSNTLTTDAVDSRMNGIRIIIESNHAQSEAGDANVRGQFERIITGRLQPQIDRIRDRIVGVEQTEDDELRDWIKQLESDKGKALEELEKLRSQ